MDPMVIIHQQPIVLIGVMWLWLWTESLFFSTFQPHLAPQFLCLSLDFANNLLKINKNINEEKSSASTTFAIIIIVVIVNFKC